MADSRRSSSRSRKQVDYSKFSGASDELDNFGDEDDDFVSFTPPISSKSKKQTAKKENAAKPGKDSKEKSSEGGRKKKRKERMSLDDKIYERDLQMALELSQESKPGDDDDDDDGPPHLEPETMPTSPPDETASKDSKSENTDENENACADKTETETTDAGNVDKKMSRLSPEHVNIRDDRDSSPEIAVTKKTTKKKGTKRKKVDDDPDEIKVLEKNVKEPPAKGRGKRKAAVKAVKKFVDSDSEEDAAMRSDGSFKADEFDDIPSDESFDDPSDNDSDFDAAPKSKKKGRGSSKAATKSSTASPKPRPRPRMSVTVTPVNTNLGRTQGLGKSFTPRPSTSLPGLNNNPPIRSGSGPLHVRKPKWMPPGPAGTSRDGHGIASPGNLRVGLSKRARIKPLHSPHVKA